MKRRKTHIFEPLLDLQEVAHLLNFSRSTIYKMIRAGEIPAIRIGGRLRVRPEEITTLLQKNHLHSDLSRTKGSLGLPGRK